MKFGDTLRESSIPQWAYQNVDYDDIKQAIKAYTTGANGQPVFIPGQGGEAKAHKEFEDGLYGQLLQQHARVDQFVRSKAGELTRRLAHFDKVLAELDHQFPPSSDIKTSVRRMERYSKLEDTILHVRQELEDIDRFVSVNRQAFHKLLKKHKKWTKSPGLSQRFNENVLSRPTSFATRDFVSALAHGNEILAASREAKSRVQKTTPQSRSPRPKSTSTTSTDGPTDSGFSVRLESSETSAPDTVQKQQDPFLPRKKRKLRRQSLRRKIQDPSQRKNIRYWNEFDDGQSPDDNAYTIYIDPNASVFPGAATVSRFAEATTTKIKSLLRHDKPPAADLERQPLLDDRASATSDEDSDLEDGSTLSPYRTHPHLPTASYSSRRNPPPNAGGKWLTRACIACGILLLVLIALGAIIFWS